VRVRRCRPPAAPVPKISMPPVRPDGYAAPGCPPRAAPRPRLPASLVCPTRASMSGMPVLSRSVSMSCAVVITQLTGVRGCQQVMAPGTNRRRHRRRQPAHRPLHLPRRAQGGQRHLHRVPEGELADADHAGRIRKTHTLFRKRSSAQMLASTATHNSPLASANTDRTPTTPL
jgi:hypothetical protein